MRFLVLVLLLSLPVSAQLIPPGCWHSSPLYAGPFPTATIEVYDSLPTPTPYLDASIFIALPFYYYLNLGGYGILRIDPALIVYSGINMKLIPIGWNPGNTFTTRINVFYPPIPYFLRGLKLRMQVFGMKYIYPYWYGVLSWNTCDFVIG